MRQVSRTKCDAILNVFGFCSYLNQLLRSKFHERRTKHQERGTLFLNQLVIRAANPLNEEPGTKNEARFF